MPLDPTLAGGLSFALGPDLLLMTGAMLLLLWAAWRPDSAEHQRRVGLASIALTLLTAGAVVWYAVQGYTASNGVIAVDNFRWASDLIFLVATVIALALGIEYNAREGILAAE